MNRESAPANPLVQVEAKRIHINAREFLEAFRDRSDDYYLMRKFSLKPKHLRKIYDQLMERGLLTEYEYNDREKKSLEVEEKTVSRATPSPAVLTPDIPPRLSASSRLSRPSLIHSHRQHHIYPRVLPR